MNIKMIATAVLLISWFVLGILCIISAVKYPEKYSTSCLVVGGIGILGSIMCAIVLFT